jgi:hypothetical protein
MHKLFASAEQVAADAPFFQRRWQIRWVGLLVVACLLVVIAGTAGYAIRGSSEHAQPVPSTQLAGHPASNPHGGHGPLRPAQHQTWNHHLGGMQPTMPLNLHH